MILFTSPDIGILFLEDQSESIQSTNLIYVGSNQVSRIYLGSTEVQRAYLGTTLVYSI